MWCNFVVREKLQISYFELFSNKNIELTQFLNNIKLNELDAEINFQSVLQTLKNKILLQPVKFMEPEIKDHYQTEKEVNLVGGISVRSGKRFVFIITVEIRFTGSQELFNYRPNGYQFSSSSVPLVYQPNG